MNYDSSGKSQIVLCASKEVRVDHVSFQNTPGNPRKDLRVDARAVTFTQGRAAETALAEMPSADENMRKRRNARRE